MSNCSFCKQLKRIKELEEEFQNNPNRRGKEDYSQEFKSALVHRTYYRGEPTGASSYTFPLNFCPECGKQYNSDEG